MVKGRERLKFFGFLNAQRMFVSCHYIPTVLLDVKYVVLMYFLENFSIEREKINGLNSLSLFGLSCLGMLVMHIFDFYFLIFICIIFAVIKKNLFLL